MKKVSGKAISRQKRLNAKSSQSARQRFSSRRMVAAGGMLLLGSFSGHALAAENVVFADVTDGNLATVTSTGNLVVDAMLLNLNNITATVSGALNETFLDSGLGDSTDNFSSTVDGNVLGALATGSGFDTLVNLALIDSNETDPDETGIASYNIAINDGTGGPGRVRADIVNSRFRSEFETDFDNATLSVSDNFALAQARVNDGISTVSGQIPAGYTDDTVGSLNTTFSGTGELNHTSTATVAVSSVQLVLSGGQNQNSRAFLNNNSATLTQDPDGATADLDTLAMNLDNNSFVAEFRGNRAVTTAPLGASVGLDPDTGGPAFEGTLAVATIQGSFGGDGAAAHLARANDTTIRASIGSEPVFDVDSGDSRLGGSLSVDGNRVVAGIVGNEALTEASLNNGLSFLGVNDTDAGNVTLDLDIGAGNILTFDSDADIALMNLQANQDQRIRGLNEGTEISAFVQSVDGGVVTLNANTASVSATGNFGSNTVAAEDANSFVGTLALGSSQINQREFVEATISAADVNVVIGNTPTPDVNVRDSVLQSAKIQVVGTNLNAAATGNRVENQFDLGGSNGISLGPDGTSALGELSAGDIFNPNLEVTGGAAIGSQQFNDLNDVFATNTGSSISITATGIIGPAAGQSTLDLNDSTIDAAATGSSAVNNATIDANDLSGSVVMASFQAMDAGATGSVDATVDGDPSISMTVGNLGAFTLDPQSSGVLDSKLTSSNNTIDASATVNRANSFLDVSATNASLAADDVTASTVNTAAIETTDQVVNAGYGLLGVQLSNADANATVTGASQTVQVLGSVFDGIAINSSTVRLGAEVTDDGLLGGNTITASGAGNVATNALSLNASLTVGGDDFAPAANVTGVQSMSGDVDTDVTGAAITATVLGSILESGVTASGNLIGASAVANRAAASTTGNGIDAGNTLDVAGTEVTVLDAGTARAGLEIDAAGITADAAFAVQNAQVFSGDLASATTSGAAVTMAVIGGTDISALDSSDLALSGNVQRANAGGNEAFNRLGFNEIVSLGATAGLNSSQISSGAVSAEVSDGAVTLVLIAAPDAAPAINDSTIALDGNRFQAIARSNQAANVFMVDPTNLTLPGDGAVAANTVGSTIDGLGANTATVGAALGLLASQSATAATTAELRDNSVSLTVQSGGGVTTGSELSIDGNIGNAAATGNQSSSALMVDVGTLSIDSLDGEDYGPLAAVASQQVASAAVTAENLGAQHTLSILFGDVQGTDLSVSGNLLQARAVGNEALGSNGAAGNRLVVSVNSVDVPADAEIAGLTMNLDGSAQVADAAFTVQNQQDASGAVRAEVSGSVGDPVLFTAEASGLTGISNTNVAVSGNVVFTRGVSNLATNALDLNGVNNFTGSAGLQNFQSAGAATQAFTGTDGTTVVPVRFSADMGPATVSSSIEVDGNQLFTTAIGNDVGNTLTADANSIVGGGSIADANFGTTLDVNNVSLQAQADFGLSSQQVLTGAVTAAGHAVAELVSGEDSGGDTTGSSLSVSENVQEVFALGNQGVNRLGLEATNSGNDTDVGASGALLSLQRGEAAVAATATMTAESTGAMATSSLALTDNFNQASATLNTVTNTLDVSSTNLNTPKTAAANANSSFNSALDLATVGADFSLVSSQRAETTVTATATTLVRNLDSDPPPVAGEENTIARSSADLSRNVSNASAAANRATNALNFDATNLGVAGGLLNQQQSSAEVTALNSGSQVAFVLDSTELADSQVSDSSTINVRDNRTTATASGNRAINNVNANAAANFRDVTAVGATGSVVGDVVTTNATFGALNSQTNSAGVSATVENAVNEVSLTGTGPNVAAITASSVRIDSNRMIAEASGNFASTTLAMSARPGGNGSAALTSFQRNTGSVTASLTASRMSATLDAGSGGVANSTSSVNGNSGIARATGNTAVNRILRSSGD